MTRCWTLWGMDQERFWRDGAGIERRLRANALIADFFLPEDEAGQVLAIGGALDAHADAVIAL